MDERLTGVLDPYSGSPDEVIPILQAVQSEYGYLPQDEMFDVARFTGVSEGKVYGIATFYAQFRFTPMGETRIMVCRGTACHVSGGHRVLDELSRQLGINEGETTEDLKYSLDTVACLGCCSLAPVVTVNEGVHGRLTRKSAAGLVRTEQAAGES